MELIESHVSVKYNIFHGEVSVLMPYHHLVIKKITRIDRVPKLLCALSLTKFFIYKISASNRTLLVIDLTYLNLPLYRSYFIVSKKEIVI